MVAPAKISLIYNIMQKINVRGIDFANVDMREALDFAKKNIIDRKTCAIYTPNAQITQDCIDDKSGELFNIINSADLVIPDGAGVVLASRILKTPLKEKVAGIELAYHIIDYLDEIGGTLFLLGSTREIVEKAANNLREKHKSLKVFYNDGFFDRDNPEENQKVIDKINESEADAVFVCLGALNLKQEAWIYKNKSKINKGVLIGLGGTIDNISGLSNKRAPKIFIKLNLEWFYRLMKNPTRIKRMMKLPKFVFGTYFNKNK
jgi:N-acetylglucosaminyldiphosphoundecaprenol N-acetyl-beta-D-mannosaminyltransferase